MLTFVFGAAEDHKQTRLMRMGEMNENGICKDCKKTVKDIENLKQALIL